MFSCSARVVSVTFFTLAIAVRVFCSKRHAAKLDYVAWMLASLTDKIKRATGTHHTWNIMTQTKVMGGDRGGRSRSVFGYLFNFSTAHLCWLELCLASRCSNQLGTQEANKRFPESCVALAGLAESWAQTGFVCRQRGPLPATTAFQAGFWAPAPTGPQIPDFPPLSSF